MNKSPGVGSMSGVHGPGSDVLSLQDAWKEGPVMRTQW